jgi:hypothetical protein
MLRTLPPMDPVEPSTQRRFIEYFILCGLVPLVAEK